MIFIDADKQNYELSIDLLKPGGLLVIDNTLLFGSVVNSNLIPVNLRGMLSELDIESVKQLNRKIKQDYRVEISMLPIANCQLPIANCQLHYPSS